MPISYAIDRNLGLLSMKASGTVTEDEILAYKGALMADSGRSCVRREICDFRDASLGISWERMGEMAEMHGEVFFGLGSTRCAVVVSSDLLFGLVSMYAQNPGRKGHEVLPFRDMAKAGEWLGLPAERT